MKNKVNVVKKIAFLMITVALAVALMACQGAVGKPGAKGDTGATGAPGPAGEPGPQGDPGVSDNASPTLKSGKTLPDVYLALGGTGSVLTNEKIKLKDYFTDKESLTLGYKIASADKTIADAEVTDDAVKITGKKAGKVTITVSVYDNVNEPTKETFSATVVDTNKAPSVTALKKIDEVELGKKLYVTSGKITRTVSSTINAGGAGTVSDSVTFSAVAGAATAADDIVTVSVTKALTGSNTYDVSITPKKPGAQRVVITAKDIFGSPSPTTLDFTAIVNKPPKLALALPDKLLVRAAQSPDVSNFTYVISRYFDTAEVVSLAVDLPQDSEAALQSELDLDVKCTVSTSPSQPVTNKVTAATIAGVDQDAKTGNVKVDSIATNPTKDAADKNIVAAGTGEFDLTITCADEEKSVSDTAEVTVRP